MSKRILPVLIFFFISGITVFGQSTQRPVWAYPITAKFVPNNPSSIIKYHDDHFFMAFTGRDTVRVDDSSYLATKWSMVLAKGDTNGGTVWQYPVIDRANEVVIKDMAIDASGNVFILGNYRGDFNVTPSLTLDSAFANGVFVMRINNDGTFGWATKGFGSIDLNQQTLAVKNDKLYVMLQNGTLAGSPVYSTHPVFVLEAANGGLLKSRAEIPGYCFDADSDGNLYIMGEVSFNNDTIFFADTFAQKEAPVINGKGDALMYSIDSSLNLRWFNKTNHITDYRVQKLLYVNSSMLLFAGKYRDSIVAGWRNIQAGQGVGASKTFFVSVNPADGSFGNIRLLDSTGPSGESVRELRVNKSGTIDAHMGISGQLDLDGLKTAFSNVLLELDTDLNYKKLVSSVRSGPMFFGSSNNTFYVQRYLSLGEKDSVFGTYYESYVDGRNTRILLKIDTVSIKVGIQPVNAPALIKVYPNPASNELYLDMETTGTVRYTITDITGKTCQAGEMEAPAPVAVSSLTNGIYFITLEVDNMLYRGKFVVAK